MLRVRYLILLVLLVPSSGACRQDRNEPASPRAIFREIATEGSTIRLGERWSADEVPGATPADTVVGLPAGTFGGAQAIRVHRTRAGIVTALMFDYPQTADFQRMRAEYTERLGPPVRHERPENAEAAERVVWQDGQTRFELTRDPKRSASTIYSRLSDIP